MQFPEFRFLPMVVVKSDREAREIAKMLLERTLGKRRGRPPGSRNKPKVEAPHVRRGRPPKARLTEDEAVQLIRRQFNRSNKKK